MKPRPIGLEKKRRFASTVLHHKWLITSVAVAVVILSSRSIFLYVGRSMAPEAFETADVLVLEGGVGIDKRLLVEAVRQMRSGRAAHLVLVTHQTAGKPSPYEIKAADRIEASLYQLGFPSERFTIILTPNIHPITLNEASIVLKRLSAEGVRSAVLMTDGFHERRSYLVYMQVGTPLGIKITPSTAFLDYTPENWWATRLGWYEFFEESAKTTYYYMRGYLRFSSVPVKGASH